MKYLVGYLLLCVSLLPAQSGIGSEFREKTRILFQGDSITDGNRGRSADPNHILGHGYVFIIAARYGSAWPERRLIFLNRGSSGDTVGEMASRWQTDTIALAPGILSILIGINDLDRHVTAEQYEEQYDRLLADTVKSLPNVRLVVGEPFCLRVGRYDNDRWDERWAELQKLQAAVARLAAKYHAALVHYQKAFDDACRRAPADYWIWDGIHPTYSGHQIMADEWLRSVDQFWSTNK